MTMPIANLGVVLPVINEVATNLRAQDPTKIAIELLSNPSVSEARAVYAASGGNYNPGVLFRSGENDFLVLKKRHPDVDVNNLSLINMNDNGLETWPSSVALFIDPNSTPSI